MTSLLTGSLAKTIARAAGPIFLPAVLTRDVPAEQTSPAYEEFDPPAPSAVTYTCKAIESEYSSGLRAQGLVGAQDVEVLILADTLPTTPQPGDRITIRGATRTIVPKDTAGKAAVTGDPARATWACRCRS